MFRQSLVATTLLIAFGTAMAAPVYKWTDPATGKTVFSDQPPPSNVKGQEKQYQSNTIQTSGPGYVLNEAIKKSPVTLYSSECGQVCNDAKALLTKRGVPFTLKNPETQESYMAELKKLTGGAQQVPVLVVAGQTIRGFESGQWNSALDEAGYPKAGGSAAPAAKPGDKAAPGATPAPAPAAPAPSTPKPLVPKEGKY